MADQRRIKGAPRRGSGGAGTGSTNGYTGRFALIIPPSPLQRKSRVPGSPPPAGASLQQEYVSGGKP
jgi:hypothetical protein